MNGFAHRILSLLLCAAACAFAAPVVRLPTAGEVLDRYVRVTGGSGAWHSKQTERDDIEGRTIDGQRVVLRATVTVSRSGNALSEIRVPQEGSEGIYKGVAWASSNFSGVRIKRGMERDEALRDSRMLEEADWRQFYPQAQFAGLEMIGPDLCYKIRLLPSTTEKVEWFSIASGLLVQRSAYELSTAGDTPVGYTVEEWAEHDGLRQPSAMVAWRGDFHYHLRVLSTTYNVAHTDLKYPAQVADYLKSEKAGQALPNAEEIVERHIFESGGPEFYEMLRTQKITGTLNFLARNIEGRMETWASGGGKYYQSTDIPGMGKQEEGSDGVIAWDRSPAIGPRVKPRKSTASLGVTLDAAGMLEWRSLIAQLRTEAQERIGDRDCYRIRLSPRDGSQDMIRWYDKATGLLYRSSLALKTDMGALPVVMTFEEYRTVSEVKWPARIRITASGQDTVFTADEVKLNVPVDDAVFEVPAEVRELAARKAAPESSMP